MEQAVDPEYYGEAGIDPRTQTLKHLPELTGVGHDVVPQLLRPPHLSAAAHDSAVDPVLSHLDIHVLVRHVLEVEHPVIAVLLKSKLRSERACHLHQELVQLPMVRHPIFLRSEVASLESEELDELEPVEILNELHGQEPLPLTHALPRHPLEEVSNLGPRDLDKHLVHRCGFLSEERPEVPLDLFPV